MRETATTQMGASGFRNLQEESVAQSTACWLDCIALPPSSVDTDAKAWTSSGPCGFGSDERRARKQLKKPWSGKESRERWAGLIHQSQGKVRAPHNRTSACCLLCLSSQSDVAFCTTDFVPRLYARERGTCFRHASCVFCTKDYSYLRIQQVAQLLVIIVPS